jgi:hypothetical protein
LTTLLIASLWLDPVLEELIHAQHRDRLSDLSLSGNLNPAGIRRFIGSSVLRQLRRLELCGPRDREYGVLDPEIVQELASAGQSGDLAELAVIGNRINDEGVAALRLASRLAGLKCLNLSDNTISDRGAVALARSSAFPLLGVLNLSHNRIGDTGALALAGSPQLGELHRLYLEGNPIGERGKQALRERFGELVRL